MRALELRPFAFAAFGLAAALSNPAFAQQAEPPEEITVEGGRTLGDYRLELERARDEVFRRFNEANAGASTDVTCKDEQPTGSRMRQNVCRSAAENRAGSMAARDFLNSMVRNAGNYTTGTVNAPPGSLVNAEISAHVAQQDGQSGEADALAKFEREWVRMLRDDQDFYQAVVRYVELDTAYNRMRGVADAAPPRIPGVAVTSAQPSGPQCEATTLTEYFQRGNAARVSGRVSISACPAGTTGSYNVVARVRDGSGEIKPLEFSETWQRDDAEDVVFEADYPIGDEVELVSVRVRGLKCTCAQP
jgi:hypothetical protein